MTTVTASADISTPEAQNDLITLFMNLYLFGEANRPDIFEDHIRDTLTPNDIATANIRPENIRLDAEVPHIRIRPTKDRELKSGASRHRLYHRE